METPKLIQDLGRIYPTKKSRFKTRYGIFECPLCKKHFKSVTTQINTGKTKSCGCYQKLRTSESSKKHGLRNHRLYGTWYQMMNRCNNDKSDNYYFYGGRGIKVCNKWHNFKNFIEDMYPSFKEGLTLDRIDNDGNYEFANCRWVDRKIQSRNQRKLRNTNKTGFKGVCFASREKKYVATITVNNKHIFIGYFKTKLEAAKAYDQYVIDNNLEHTINGVL